MRIYLSGPISLNGTASPEQIATNMQAFAHHAARLRKAGHEVFSPTEIDLGHDEGNWNDYMRVCIAEVARSDQVYTLPGWQQSRGSRLEVFIALEIGIAVMPV